MGEIQKESIELRPIGYARTGQQRAEKVSLDGEEARLHIDPCYRAGLQCVTEHEYLWVLSWFNQAERELLQVVPSRVNPDLGSRGVFAIRCAVRPNPVALSLVRLVRQEDCVLLVTGYDGIDGTPILDLKPYFDADSIFSPGAPYLPRKDPMQQEEYLYKLALRHHGEDCEGLRQGVRLAGQAEAEFGYLQAPDLCLEVEGEPCLADVLQGLTRARFSHPPRFVYRPKTGTGQVIWSKGGRVLRQTSDAR